MEVSSAALLFVDLLLQLQIGSEVESMSSANSRVTL